MWVALRKVKEPLVQLTAVFFEGRTPGICWQTEMRKRHDDGLCVRLPGQLVQVLDVFEDFVWRRQCKNVISPSKNGNQIERPALPKQFDQPLGDLRCCLAWHASVHYGGTRA
eukprot:CAMPEP_0194518164 /NCGR_PEP_ID=MMETSP0253-20130528/51521_1 /TAXON_ID=2966 /ORGANISM="Noctiluca scintillans" /LENGTH=111 /DNA_ID=CAMNT_0039362191 /DNA_START=283 /DNA_END=618 /DNA_ORIENTATION=-